MIDRRKTNTLSKQQRRAAIYKRRKLTPAKISKSRLEVAKTVLRRHYSDVFDAALCDRRFKGLIYVGTRRYTHKEVIDMAAEILAKEEARNRELRSLYKLDLKRKG